MDQRFSGLGRSAVFDLVVIARSLAKHDLMGAIAPDYYLGGVEVWVFGIVTTVNHVDSLARIGMGGQEFTLIYN